MKGVWISRCAAMVLVLAGVGCGARGKPADAGRDVAAPRPDAPADVPLDLLLPDGADAAAEADAPPPSSDAPLDAADGDADDVGVPPDSRDADVECGAPSDPKNCGICGRDCSRLAHVKPDAGATCRNGTCMLAAGACMPGFAHCSANGNQGCETDVTTPASCGGCGLICPATQRVCSAPPTEPATCVASCTAPGLTACGSQCVDVQSHPFHCGACNARCLLFGATSECVAGKCEITRCLPGSADCDPRPGCETLVTTFYDCGACGRSCAAANATGLCEKSACSYTCRPGFGDCDPAKPDCEKPLDTGAACGACGKVCPGDRPLCGGPPGQEACVAACAPSAPDLCGTTCTSLRSDPRHCGACGTACDGYQSCVEGRCTPRYVHTDVVGEGVTPTAVAMGPDGSFVVAGTFAGDVDFNPGPGQDVQQSVGGSAVFVTRYNADGSYAWTRSFPTAFINDENAVVVASDGRVIVSGTATNETFVVSLDPAGTMVWARTFAPASSESSSGGAGVAVATDGTLVVVGGFSGRVDFDPGPGVDVRESDLGPAGAKRSNMYAAKLSSAGQLQWARIYRGDFQPRAIKTHPNGTFWIGGTFTGLADFDPSDDNDERSPIDAMDGFITRLDAEGNHQGSLLVSPAQSDTITTIAFDADGAAYLGGNSSLQPGGSVFFVVKVTAEGMGQWSQTGAAWQLLAAAPGGGLFTGGTEEVVPGIDRATVLARKRNGGGNAHWTVSSPIPIQYSRQLAAADATKLIVVGVAAHGGDYDPGAATDLIADPRMFVSQYAF